MRTSPFRGVEAPKPFPNEGPQSRTEGGQVKWIWLRMRVVMTSGSGMMAHVGLPGPAPFIAMGLFFAGFGAAYGAFWFFNHPSPSLQRAPAVGLGVIAFGCFVLATIFPLLLGARPSLGRPSTTASLEIVSPREGDVFPSHPASIPVELQLDGGTVVPYTSLRLAPNEGHIHLYLDGSLVSMTTALDAQITASPGQHELRAEFVAVDHGPFQPRVVATVTFSVHS
jgi:hypothetical protein